MIRTTIAAAAILIGIAAPAAAADFNGKYVTDLVGAVAEGCFAKDESLVEGWEACESNRLNMNSDAKMAFAEYAGTIQDAEGDYAVGLAKHCGGAEECIANGRAAHAWIFNEGGQTVLQFDLKSACFADVQADDPVAFVDLAVVRECFDATLAKIADEGTAGLLF